MERIDKAHPMRSFLAWLVAITVVATVSQAQTKTGSSPPPDVYLITIDTLRSDHVHCYGYDPIQTPAIDSLARDGIRFTQAFTPSPITNTAHTSILTGLLPSVHGVTNFGIPLATIYPTWAELLKQNGYQTAAFIGAVILDSRRLAPGLDRGFDYYDNFPTDAKESEHWGAVERRGPDVVERAQTWMDAHPGNPRFVWVHLYDPHDPYEPPAPYSQIYKDRLYDGEIAYADSALANLLSYLVRENRYRNALIILVGDHGEGLGEHGEQTHGVFLYDATTHVPLILKLPAGEKPSVQASKVVEAQIQTTDLLPTVLDLLAISPPAALAKRSLRPYLVGTVGDRVVFGETDYPQHFGWEPLRAVRSGGYKFIEAPRPELYDLGKDPAELKNMYAAGSLAVQQLRSEIASSGMKAPQVSLPDAKDKIEEQNLLHSAVMLVDEGRVADAQQLLQKALQLNPDSPTALQELGELEFNSGEYRKAADHLDRVRKTHPDNMAAAVYEGQALDKLGDSAAARSVLEAALTQSPSQLDARLLLAHIDLKSGDRVAAEDQFEAALILDPANHVALLGLGHAYLTDKRYADLLELLEPRFKDGSGGVDELELLVQGYAGAGRSADAEKVRARLDSLQKQ
jgi:choline-sulfatase